MRMYVITILLGFCLVRSGLSVNQRNVEILRYDNNVDDIASGSYSFGYESSDGSTRQEFGHLLLPGTEDEHMKVNGSFSYVGPDGVTYTVRYTADDQGFHPEGDHFKVPPFVPWIHRHGQSKPGEEGTNEQPDTPQFSSGERILDTFRTTPKPTTEYLPQGSSENLYGANAPKLTTQYLPSSSTPSSYFVNKLPAGSGSNFFTTQTPKPSTQYLPTSTTPGYNFGSRANNEFLSTQGPKAEVFLRSSPQAQTPIGFFAASPQNSEATDTVPPGIHRLYGPVLQKK